MTYMMTYKEISEKEALIGSQYSKERDFWLKRLSGEPVKSSFPYDLKRTNGNEYRINSRQYQLSPALSEKLTALSKGLDHRLHIILSAGLAALLHKYTGSNDIIYGIPIYKQEVKGDFINTVLVIRNQFEDNISFKNLLLLVRQNTTEFAENQNYPIEALLYRLNMPYTEGDFPLFDITLLMENIHDKTYIAHIRHNMMFSFLRTGQMIEARLDYNSLLYEKETIDRIMNHFIRLITQVVDNLNLKIARIEILSEEEKRHLLEDFNHTKSDYPRDKTIHELFQDQVEASPGKIAAVFEGEEVLSYQALDQKANTLAGYLALKGVTVDVMVGIMSERSLETIIGILAILKAGGVYLPIDSQYPAKRKKYMIKDSNLEILLENCDYSDIKDIVPGIIDLGNPGIYTEVQDFGKVNRFNNLAYVIYTSGTTANPKGVMVEHRSVVRLVKNTNYVKFQEDDRVLPTGALEFDASTFELWGALLNGLQLHLVSIEKILTHETLKEIVRNYRITTLWMTSPLFNQMVDADVEIFAGLKNLLVGGDALSPFHINKIRKKFPQCNVINGYGPTENTTFSTTYLIKQEYMDSIPIGKPIANSTAYIIDRHNNLVPRGAVGEIWVGGDGVARGYLNNPDLTAERFVTSKKIYKTGDLGRWLPDRNIEFLGRIDQQIKIRGYRIEPGEIESQLLKTGLINETVVLVREYENKEKYLCAYFVSKQEINKTELRSRLQQNLPDYMVPAFFVRLNSIPLTPNKKVDKKVLPAPVFNAEADYVGPRNEIEEKLVKIWLEVLWQDERASSSSDIQIGIDDNFFELGGHSIKAMSLVSKIHKELNVKLPLEEVFINPSIRRLAEYIKGTVKDRYAAIEPVEEKEYYSLSSAQKRLYFIYQLAPESTAYHLPFSQEVGGDIEIRKLKRIFRQLIQRHESLRTFFILNGGAPFQKIHKTVEFEIQHYSTEGPMKSALNKFVRPFDFSKAPLMRVGVMKSGENRHLLLVDMHHIITDGFSQNILSKEFMALYSGEELISSRLHLQYKDFSEWQTSAEQQKRLKQQELYWLKEFSDELPVLNLPTDYPRPLLKSYDGNQVNFLLTEQETRALKDMALKTDSTLFGITLAIYTILLSKLGGQDDIIVGIPTASRRHADLEQIIGMFVNALPTRNYPSLDKTFKEYLTEVQTRVLSVLENQDYQFEDLVDRLSVPRDTSRNPIYDVLLNFLELQNNPGDMPVMENQRESPDIKISAKFDLNLQTFYLGTKMYFSLEYCTMLFKQETIERIAGYFKKIVASILENPQQQIMKIEIIPAERKQEILMRFNRDLQDPPVVDTIQDKLVKSSRENRDKIAIEYGEVEITYSQLDKRAGAISGWIRQHGIERGRHIGIYMDNRIDIISIMIGILKAGAVFVPLDTTLPQKRIQAMVVRVGIRVIFTDSAGKQPLLSSSDPAQNLELIDLEEDISFDSKDFSIVPGKEGIRYEGEDKIYIYFTSGTTGTPEAIVGKNSSLVHFINWEIDTYGFTPGLRVSQLSAVGFDAFLRNVFTPLCGGGVVCIPGNTKIVMDGTALMNWLDRTRIHWVHCVPALFRLFNTKSLTPGLFKELKYIFLSGEVIIPSELKNWYGIFDERIQLVNYYGPTETTMIKFYYPIGKKDTERIRIPVGKPIRGTSAIILDENLGVCDRGITGEIFIRTPYRTFGYYDNEPLNKQKFLANPFANDAGDWVHRPGDLGRELWDGNFEFLGRKDGQLKIRGVRVELGEIQNHLQKHEKIKGAAAAIKEVSGENYLCAYIISDLQLPAAELRKYLAQTLPDYMIPSFFIPVEEIPLTSHGKLDWRKLPEPEIGTTEKYAAPRNMIEEQLVEIWQKVLFGDELHLSRPEAKIGIDDNFFQLGGHSLKATVLAAKIHEALDVKLPLAEIFRKPTIRELGEYIRHMVKEVHTAIEPVEEKEYYPLSSAQKRLYIIHQFVSDYISYNIPDVIPLNQEITKEKLEMVFKRLISRHESLRTSFRLVNEEPVQRIHRQVDFSIHYNEVSEEEAGDFIANFPRPFDLSEAPLLRVYLLNVKSRGQVLLIDIHHIITDGASQAILRKEFTGLYRGEDYPLLRLQYKDFSQWQLSENGTERLKRQEAYWLKVFEDDIPVLNLPTDFSRPAVQSFAGDSVDMQLPVEEVEGLKIIGGKQGATLHMVLLALFNVLMSRLAIQEDIVIGTPAAGRRHSDLEKIIGMFVNMLAIRTQPKGKMSFTTFLGQVKKRMLEAIENQEYHFEELVEKTGVNRDTGRNPLFDIVFSLNIMPVDTNDTGPATLEPAYKKNAAKFDLTLTAVELAENVLFRLEYCVKLFKKETMERFLMYYRVLVASVLENKDMSISRLEIIPVEEKNRLLYEFNNTETGYPRDKTIHELFELQVQTTPDNIAVVGNHQTHEKHEKNYNMSHLSYMSHISYKELNRKSTRLARTLIQKGTTADTIVGLLVERSIEMIIGILGILKSGAGYMPIEPDYPQERINFMLKDSKAEILLTRQEISSFSLHPSTLPSSHLHLPPAPATSLAYIMYTSGSTGYPKGVMVEHKNVVRLVENTNYIKFSRETRILQTGAPVFDATTFEIWGALLHGGTLYLVPNDVILDTGRFGQELKRNHINTLWLSASLFNQMVQQESRMFTGLQWLLVGGDVLSPPHINRVKEQNQGLKIVNGYGPTENTTFSTTYLIDRGFKDKISIGKPINNSTAYILDTYNHLCPLGVVGELYVGGDGVSRGYMNNPELTAEKFDQDLWDYQDYHNQKLLQGVQGAPWHGGPIRDGFVTEDVIDNSTFTCNLHLSPLAEKSPPGRRRQRIYKTGDLARWLPDGNIDFIGRLDYQVKIRGFRVELGEIENRLSDHPGITECIVLMREEEGEKYLSAYVVTNGEFTASDLRQYMSGKVPDYMIPSYFITLGKMPLNPNGKIDRKALPKPEAAPSEKYTAPRNQIEKKMVKIWGEILGREGTVGIDDDFFELGGHSLKATILVSRMHKEFNVKVPLAEVFRTPEIRELAAYIKTNAKDIHEAVEPAEEKEYYLLSPAQKRLYVLQQMILDNTSYNIPLIIPMGQEIDREKLGAVFKILIRRHESLRTSFGTINEEPVQQIHKEVSFSIGYREVPEKETREIIANFIRPFDLSQAPLLRVDLLLEINSRRHILLIDMHHIITDGLSQEILRKEFTALYQGEELPALKLQYRDFSQWQTGKKKKENLKHQESYWVREFKGEIPVLDLPLDYSRPVVQSFEGDRIDFQLSADQVEGLKEIVRQENATLYMVLLALYTVLLSKLSGQEDIVIGTPISGRRHTDLDKIIGMFVNTLPLRNAPEGNKTFREFLSGLKEKTVQAFENQEYPFEELVEKVGVKRDVGRNPLFDVMFSLQNVDVTAANPSVQAVSTGDDYGNIVKTSKFDLNLTGLAAADMLAFKFEYSTNLFNDRTILKFINYFNRIVSMVAGNAGVKTADIEIVPDEEKKQILYDFNAVTGEIPLAKNIPQLFEEQVERTPAHIAIISQTAKISYREYNEKANRLGLILKEKGVGPNCIVGLMVERSIEMIIGIMGILKAGGAYLPIDPDYPAERVNYMLEDSRSPFLLTGSGAAKTANYTGEVIDIETTCSQGENRNPGIKNDTQDLVYMIYTSGSTGRPKGVMVKIDGFLNLLHWYVEEFKIGEEANLLLIAPVSFDLAQKNLFSPHFTGGCLTLAAPGIPDYQELSELIHDRQVTLINCAPSVFYPLVELNSGSGFSRLKSLRQIILGGEPIRVDKMSAWVNSVNYHAEIVNTYGPTECTDIASCYRIPNETFKDHKVIPIGKPIQNVKIFILDKYMKVLPLKLAGELCIGGVCVSKGYYNNRQLTGEKFVNTPHLPEKKVYRTGDLTRWLEDGNIEFLGRIDHQVKVRGYRIELGEIESELSNHHQIKDAVVVTKRSGDDNNYLCAYIVSEREIPVIELREYLGLKLPGYMIPAYFVYLEQLPLTPSGKVNRNGLPEPGAEAADNYTAPRDKIESKLVEIWSEVLGIEESSIGIEANFFHLGGHSLQATIMVSRIHKRLNVKVPLAELFKTPTIRGFAGYLKGTATEKYQAIQPGEEKEYYPLSPAQKRLYILQQIVLDNTGYNIPFVIPIEQEIDREKLGAVFKILIDRHESLRTSFETVNEEPIQKIHQEVHFSIRYKEVSEKEAGEIISNFIKPFDLTQAPLLRVDLLLVVQSRRQVLLIDMHHIITDGMSQDILINEFMALYRGVEISPLRLQYKDFSQWQNSEQETEKLKHQEAYWLNEFKGEIPVLDLPVDYSRPMVQSFQGNKIEFELCGDEVEGLREIARKEGVTLYMVLLGVYNILLSKLSGQEDIVIGTPVAGRRHADLEKIIGMFVNTLALRNSPQGDMTFSAFLSRVKEKTLEAFENQEYPFEELVDQAGVKRDMGRSPLFDVMFSLESLDPDKRSLSETAFNRSVRVVSANDDYKNIVETSKFDLTLNAVDAEQILVFSFNYCTKLFEEETIERFIYYFKKIVLSIVENPGIKCCQVEIISENERKQLLYDFNDTDYRYPGEKTIQQLFEEQVERSSDDVALIYLDRKLTYNELNQRSNHLARKLRNSGVKDENIVGILLDRSLEMIIGILAVLKSGGAYLPLDPQYPLERINFIVQDSHVKLLITQEDISSRVSFAGRLIVVNDKEITGNSSECSDLKLAAATEDIAYIIYTSGSTGKPRGVMIEHFSVINLAFYQKQWFKITAEDRVLQFSSISFDASVEQVFIALFSGAKLVLIDKEHLLDANKFEEFIVKNSITHIHAVPSFLKTLAVPGNHQLKRVVSGGDICPKPLASKWSHTCKFYNEYGPTETTVTSIQSLVENLEKSTVQLPIGRPLANTTVYILDRWGNLAPGNVIGELYIGGHGVARGYLNRPELTADRFVTFDNRSYKSYRTYSSKKLYKTGDLARWLPDGNIDFIGRVDYQVKIRGYRIEPGEIENRLIKHPRVKEAVVTTREDKQEEKYLCAYIVGNRPIEPPEIKKYLSAALPDYMIPAYIVEIESIPLTPNGKVDRNKLPEPEARAADSYMAPRDQIESKLVGIWSEVLGIEKEAIGIEANFFHLGGHSLKATIMVSKIHKELNVKVPLTELFKTPTIQGFAGYIKGTAAEKYQAIQPGEQKEYYALSPTQKRLYILQQMVANNTGYNIPFVIPIEQEINREKLETVFKILIRRHESLRTSFETVNEEPFQKIHREVYFSIGYKEVSERDAREIISNFIRPFDLSQAPLLRVDLLLDIESHRQVLLIDMHHIITDGMSQDILTNEFMSLYWGEEIPVSRLQYKDFSQWQNSEKEREKLKHQEAYWLKEFPGEIPVLDLPADYSRPVAPSFEGDGIDFRLSGDEVQGLREIARKENVTLYMVLLGLYTVLLSKLSGQEDIVIGTPVAGRRHADLEKIIGMFVNTLALRNYPEGDKTFREFLSGVRERTLDAFENQEYPFEDLVEKVEVKRDMGRNPLFDVMFSLQSVDVTENDRNQPEWATNPSVRVVTSDDDYRNIVKTSKFDMELNALDTQQALLFSLQYSTKLFKKQTIERFINYFKKILLSVVENPGIKCSQIEIISEKERNQVLYDFNNTLCQYSQDKTIHKLFEEQVERTPDHIALVGPTYSLEKRHAPAPRRCVLTYRELNERSYHLSQILRSKGLEPDTIVAIMTERSVEMIVGILGILKSGAAYLPIDKEYPRERIDFMLKDSGANIIVTTEAEDLWAIDRLSLPEPAPSNASSQHIANIIYTSGTTGKPKGVMVEHRNLVAYMKAFEQEFRFSGTDTVVQQASYSFDAFGEEIFPILLKGGKIAIPTKEEVKDINLLSEFIMKYNVTIIDCSPLLLDRLNRLPDTGAIHTFISGGDVLKPEYIGDLLKRGQVYNTYGPTETTICAAYYKYKPGSGGAGETSIPIGKPIANYKVYLLDRYTCLLPVGVPGELCIAGPGVTRGYLNRPELTAEKFVSFFHRSDRSYKSYISKKIYRTGDLARWLPDGKIQYLGRIDSQVKIRGFRIELGEIENRLLKHEKIKEAVVVMDDRNPSGDKYLCAYTVPVQIGTIDINTGELREYLFQSLPDYMIPSFFVPIQQVPLTSNGKVDRKALPKPEVKIADNYTAPRDEIESKLVEIWSEVLGIEKKTIGIEANFFHLGGHSLKATIMTSKIHKEFNISIPLSEIFKTPMVYKLAEYIKNSETAHPGSKDDNLVLLRNYNGSTKNLFFVHDGSGEVDGYMEFANRLNIPFNCWGIRANKIDGYSPKKLDIEDTAAQYIQKIKKIQPHGPYYIIGWSLGGTICFEIVKQLEALAQEIGFLGIVDSPAPHKKFKKYLEKFDLESELRLLEKFLPDDEMIKKTLKKQNETSGFWQELVDYLEKIPGGIEIARKLAAHHRVDQLLDFNQFNARDSIYYLNRCRTLYNARGNYIPTGKINTVLHFFKASQSRYAMRKNWDKFVHWPVKDYEISGDHYSLFKMPAVENLVNIFEKVIFN